MSLSRGFFVNKISDKQQSETSQENKKKFGLRDLLYLPVLSSAAGLIILVIMTIILFSLAFLESAGSLILFLVILGLVLLGTTRQCFYEWGSFCELADKTTKWNKTSLGNAATLYIGALCTYFLSVNLGLGPVVAASLIGITGALIVKNFAVPIYCGAFVGMVSHDLAQGYLFLSLAALIAGLTFIFSSCTFNGYGGKLGTIAFTGCVSAAVILGKPLLSAPVPELHMFWQILLFSSLGAVLTYVLSIRFKLGPVLASGLVGIFGGLTLPGLFPASGRMLAIVVICASFAGMSSKERIANEFLVFIAALIVGLIFIFSSPYLGGAGGKLGTIAFGASLAVSGIVSIRPRLFARLSRFRQKGRGSD
jgi:hypothetical protein